jgi:8-oxo-dGTP diphosphatase
MATDVDRIYGNRLRVRVCGMLVENDALLLVNHRSLGVADFWSPPGGGLNFEEPARGGLKREFKEETGLEVEVLDFLFASEFIHPPLHAVELFFKVQHVGGSLKRGSDPEMKEEHQIIQQVAYLSWEAIGKLEPNSLHGIFRQVDDPRQIVGLRGYFEV